jgi:hypothetical protein
LVAWRRDVWAGTLATSRRFSVSVFIMPPNGCTEGWWLTAVYGPTLVSEKAAFLDKLRSIKLSCPGPAIYCGDFNLIYRDQDKNQGAIHRSWMRRFRRVIDDLLLAEVHLHGRLYTWSSERRRPTMERIDRVFTNCAWLDIFPNHYLACLSTDCSDHAPLSLRLDAVPWAKPMFRFEAFWLSMDAFDAVVAAAWSAGLSGADACKSLDFKLRNTAKALRSWSASSIGSVRSQLVMARLVVAELDVAQETRSLDDDELELRRDLKRTILGLASLSRTIARQRSCIRYLREGDANTKFFHLQACHRKRKSYIPTFEHTGLTLTDEEAKADAIYDYFNGILGTYFARTRNIDLAQISLPQLDLDSLAAPFTVEEVWVVIKDIPNDRAPGPDGFTGRFYKAAWATIKDDIVAVFNSFWELDRRSFHMLNTANMVLLRKTSSLSRLKDYRPISLMHSVGKLVAKVLATRLALHLSTLIQQNQSAFIQGRCIHDNFMAVQLACR